MAILERLKTFFVLMTEGEVTIKDTIEEVTKKEVEAVEAQESGYRRQKEQEGKNESVIPLEDKGVVQRVKVSEEAAKTRAAENIKGKQAQEHERND